jgi:primosomal protein N'
MIAEVIPYTRTIRGKDYFDYAVPTDLVVQRGDVVEIVFRGKRTVGLVWNCKSQSSVKRLQTIVGLHPFSAWRNSARLEFLEWFSRYYVISLPTAFRTIQFPLLKRPRSVDVLQSIANADDRPSKTALSVKDQIVPHAIHVVRYQHRVDCLQLYRDMASAHPGRLLIIVPEYGDCHVVQQAVSSVSPTIAWHDDPSPSAWSATLSQLAQEESVVCIGTKRAVFLPWNLFDTVIVDQEESRSHKQFDQNPRYHVRAVAEQLSSMLQKSDSASPTVLFTSHAPTVDIYQHAQERGYRMVNLLRPWSDEHITVVDMEQERMGKNYSWFSDVLVDAVRSSTHAFVFLNRTGYFGVAMCIDCSTLLAADVTTCTQCRGQRIRYIRKGTQKIEEELRQLFPRKTILRVDRDQDPEKLTDASLQSADIILGTEKLLRLMPLSYFDVIGILSVDHLLVYPHFRSHERVFQLLTTLCSIPVRTILQTASPHHPVIRAATQNHYERFAEDELALRRVLRLPPFAERYQLIDTKTRQVRTVSEPLKSEQLSTDIVVDRLSG